MRLVEQIILFQVQSNAPVSSCSGCAFLLDALFFHDAAFHPISQME